MLLQKMCGARQMPAGDEDFAELAEDHVLRLQVAMRDQSGFTVRPEGRGFLTGVTRFEEAGRFSFSIIQANETALAVLSGFLFLAAAVGIVNSMLMSVHERTREIGTVRALGMRRAMVVRLFILEGLALGVVAATAGIVLGASGVLYYGARGIPMDTMTLAWVVAMLGTSTLSVPSLLVVASSV